MNEPTLPQTVLFPDLFDRPLVAVFDQPHASSDGGAVLLKAADRALGLTARVAAAFPDARATGRVTHAVRALVAQRIFGIACGYPDGNDADGLADDPIQKLLLDRDPEHGLRLASQPTVSRFEHTAGRRDLRALTHALADTVIAHQRARCPRARRITIDLDGTDVATHGAQQLSFFSGHYHAWCYLPLLAFLTIDDEPRQYLVSAMLRRGNAGPATGARALLRALIQKVEQAFPRARIRVRLDAGFATPAIFDLLEVAGVDYVVAMATNAVLDAAAAPALATARAEAEATGASARLFTEVAYQARRWTRSRRAVIKAEVVTHPGREPRDNPRIVITNLRHAPERLYTEIYCARGDSENRIKELHHDLALGRTSCTRFTANAVRVLFSAAAYVLLQELQRRAEGTSLARAQVARIRLVLIKIGVRVVRSVRRLVLHLPRAHPDRDAWHHVATHFGAVLA